MNLILSIIKIREINLLDHLQKYIIFISENFLKFIFNVDIRDDTDTLLFFYLK